MSNNSLSIFALADAAPLTLTDKKGNERAFTPEGAIFKGGKALAEQMKDASVLSAFSKAGNGKYRAAADILEVAFPKAAKAAAAVNGEENPSWANKQTMVPLILAAENTKCPEKGWNAKQEKARILLRSLRTLPAFKVDADVRDTIEAS